MLRQNFNVNYDDDSIFLVHTMIERQKTLTNTPIPFQYEQITPINTCMYLKYIHTHNSNVYQMSQSARIEFHRACVCVSMYAYACERSPKHICIRNFFLYICLNGVCVFQLPSIYSANFWISFSFTNH